MIAAVIVAVVVIARRRRRRRDPPPNASKHIQEQGTVNPLFDPSFVNEGDGADSQHMGGGVAAWMARDAGGAGNGGRYAAGSSRNPNFSDSDDGSDSGSGSDYEDAAVGELCMRPDGTAVMVPRQSSRGERRGGGRGGGTGERMYANPAYRPSRDGTGTAARGTSNINSNSSSSSSNGGNSEGYSTVGGGALDIEQQYDLPKGCRAATTSAVAKGGGEGSVGGRGSAASASADQQHYAVPRLFLNSEAAAHRGDGDGLYSCIAGSSDNRGGDSRGGDWSSRQQLDMPQSYSALSGPHTRSQHEQGTEQSHLYDTLANNSRA